VFWHSIALGAIVGLIVIAYAYVFPGGVLHGLTFVKQAGGGPRGAAAVICN
jgi:hypothetical protein